MSSSLNPSFEQPPHGELAASFQDSRLKLWIGVVAGSIFWGLIIVYTAVDALRILDGD